MKSTFTEKIFYTVNYLILFLIAMTCLLPLVHLASLSLSDSHAVLSGRVTLWPVGWTLESYQMLWEGTRIVEAFGNSLIITVVGVILSMICTILTAYPLSRRYFFGRRWFLLAAVFTMLFAGGTIPTYLVIKELGLVNNYGALWLPALVNTYNMLVLRTFFENIPEELEDAARMDGCGEWRMLIGMMLPLSLPALATLTLFYGVGFWNSFLSVLIYINETDKYNLTVLVQQMIRKQSLLQELVSVQPEDAANLTPEGIKAAGVMVLIIPMMIVYPFLQKYFVKGVMLGSIKG
ncbi:carbohydrate ABC transporter permease [Paenibacillus mucilaginosus]|uniref:Binding-protein-dependent transport systems inner membrane component n=3 Tax=Paenibacillus mucilaginosus TaxID=61624 RepID=H6NQS8_9BACL|nr:carbohydrate ABC transporter permease [Paenibacillus mucilaginosus]AEI38933.1 binding-protein-dependent transport systems inner membrane component [Paenibacillus mucilaginosus KNP414]AFC27242.1 binding-protein-dependent transport systems inner membrane component [Paenibacillus mucilaginosus 3016]AFH59382.1 ABC transporter permease [Paenibacillus mucilaginosus K02]MCG7216556.1 carbohydrate ABC transporter permease [Paenibacillus mucilaginosus]WDM27984.1 carbohydrate ABC transporter permease 